MTGAPEAAAEHQLRATNHLTIKYNCTGATRLQIKTRKGHGQPGPGSRQLRTVPALVRSWGFPVNIAGCRIGPKSDLRVGSGAISPPYLHLLKCHEKAENTRGKNIACAETRSHLTASARRDQGASVHHTLPAKAQGFTPSPLRQPAPLAS